jgi:hypothetical protein
MMGAMQTTIEPSVVYHTWFPATVLHPRKEGERRPVMTHTAKVYATDAGLYVYNSKAQLVLSSPIDFTRTVKPINGLPGYAHDVFTEAGLVVVTKTGGCGCGTPAKGFRPSYAHKVGAWPTV